MRLPRIAGNFRVPDPLRGSATGAPRQGSPGELPGTPSSPGRIFAVALAAGALIALPTSPASAAVDEESCLDCHGHPGLARLDSEGREHSFFIDDHSFGSSAHSAVRCGECHQDIQKIPHGKTRRPDCTVDCHLQEPSTGMPFSHKRVAEYFARSAHGIKEGPEATHYPDDLPTCVTCHRNDPIRPSFEFRSMQSGAAEEVLTRCLDCHPKREFAERFYAHFTARLRQHLRPLDLVRLCTGCHEDEPRMARHGLEVTSTLRDTYHWKLVLMGDGNAPDCLSCHVPVGVSVHNLRHKQDPASPVHPKNRQATCTNQGGIQRCHANASEQFAAGPIHASGAKAEVYAYLQERLSGRRIEAAMAEAALQQVTKTALLEQEVMDLVRSLYKVMIALVVGSMFLHQLLDLLRRLLDARLARRKAKEAA